MSFEILEHTADVGIRGTGATPEEAFASVAEGLASLMGAWFPGEGEERPVRVEAADREALLAAWVDELLYLHEAGDAVFGSFRVERVGEGELEAVVAVAPRAGRELEDVGVKAATFHRLRVAEEPDGTWEARIYLDV